MHTTPTMNPSRNATTPKTPRIVITAGPTFEPIDTVRYLGNRSSGRMGIALANESASRGWDVRLLLGPVAATPDDSRITVARFRTCSDLEALLNQEAPGADILVMAAAVADYRPKPNPAMSGGKFRRGSGNLMLELEPTPDLIAEVASRRRPGQLLIGFALEPRDELLASAKSKLERKRLDMVVGNALETMEADGVESAVIVEPGGRETRPDQPSGMAKSAFAVWLVDRIAERFAAIRASAAVARP